MKTLRTMTMLIVAFTVGTSGSRASAELRAGPRFEDLENSAAGADQRAAAARLVGDAIPSGTPLPAAETLLRRLGASCPQNHVNRAAERCYYIGPTMFDGDLVETVYWTVALNTQEGRVVGITVNRKLDIH